MLGKIGLFVLFFASILFLSPFVASALDSADTNDSQSVSERPEPVGCILKDGIILLETHFARENIAKSEEIFETAYSEDVKREYVQERIQTILSILAKQYRIVEAPEECPNGMEFYRPSLD